MTRLSKKQKDDFKQAIFEIVASIPKGRVASYGEVARLAGYPGYQRMVGRTLRYAPHDISLPCHRVLTFQGRLVPGWTMQAGLLRDEGITLKANGHVDMNKFGWNPMKEVDE